MSNARQDLIDSLEDILYEVQYAKVGDKTATRKKYARLIIQDIETAYKANKLIGKRG